MERDEHEQQDALAQVARMQEIEIMEMSRREANMNDADANLAYE